MLTYEVDTKSQLKAAIRAAAQPTYEAARANPVLITWGRARYLFTNGIHATRAEALCRNIGRACA